MKFAYILLSFNQYSELIILKKDDGVIENKIYYDQLQKLSLKTFSVAFQIIYKGTTYKVKQFLIKNRILYKILDFIIANKTCHVMLQ